MTHVLPEDFSALEPFAGWALRTETERSTKRNSSTQAEIVSFAEAMLPQVDGIAAYVDRFGLHALPEDAERLMCMMLSLAEVAPAVEAYRQPSVVDGYDARRFAADEKLKLRPKL